MQLSKLKKKLSLTKGVVKQDGVIELGIISLQKIKRHTKKGKVKKRPVLGVARYNDVISADFNNTKHIWKGTDKQSLTINWVMPPPGKGSGGHMTLFRFIEALEKEGHTCRLYFYTQNKGGSVERVRSIMGESFPKLSASMQWLNRTEDMKDADAIFATSWETAYPVFNSNKNAKRLYFVQDFEPYFYPVGGMYTLAENTYRFNFHGITAGGWLAQKLNKEYGMDTDPFSFGADNKTYQLKNTMKRKEVMCYVRPNTDRRGFEIAIMALDLFSRKHPDHTINLFGADVSDFEIPFAFNNLGILETDELNDLYNRCSVGLVMSCTNMSLLPLELLRCGTIPVVNDGDNNRLVSDNRFISYAKNDPVSLADTMSNVVNRKDIISYSKEASSSVELNTWGESTERMANRIAEIIRKKA